MKVLVLGNGGREHAIIMKLLQSSKVTELHCAPGNAGISKHATCHSVSAVDINGIVKLSKELRINMVVVAPDNPLVLGMVDSLEREGIVTFGPNRDAAQIEGSKIFAKKLMMDYNIPTADCKWFYNADLATKYIKTNSKYPIVIKADGLAFGKGVIIANNYEEAIEAINLMMRERVFGNSGSNIVIEEFLSGPEVSVLSFTDGKVIVPMISSMDHKRALNNDEGLNTGGMGVIAPNPFYTEAIAEECMNKIYIPTIEALNKEGITFKGCLYFGLMLTPTGPKVIEYNCRFGDPEAQAILPLLKTDLFEIMNAVHAGKLNKINIEWYDAASACVVLASKGYPEACETGKIITGLDNNGQLEGVTVYHANTKFDNDNNFVTAGGRVLGITATGTDLEEAIKKAYQGVQVSYSNIHYRDDIGAKALSYIKKL